MAIKNVIFDLGGVLIDWNPRYLFRKVFNDDERMEYFLHNVATAAWNSQMDAGRPFEEGISELRSQFPEFSEQIKLYYTGWEQMLGGTIPEGVALLEAIRQSGRYVTYALTNWSAQTFPTAYARFDFLKDFEGIVVSGEEKMIKPAKGLYLTLLERYHLEPTECLFIDDNPANVATAVSRGMTGEVFDNPPVCAARIAKLLGVTLNLPEK